MPIELILLAVFAPVWGLKNLMTSLSVFSGVVVSMRLMTKSSGPVPTAQMNFVPPASIPPYILIEVFTIETV
jgi:hypothetical protein